MKKFTALLLAFILVIGLTACGSGTGAGNGTGSGDTSTGGISKSSQEFIGALNAENAEEKGICGADLTWYYKDNVLVIKGTGTMNDYDYFREIEAPWYDKGLMNKVHWLIIEDGATYIGDEAFSGIGSLSKVELPSTIETIGDGAFAHCDSLSSITIPGSVAEIGSRAFLGCDSLSSITIPSSVKELGDSAFSCISLTSVTFEGDAPKMEEADSIFDNYELEQLTVTYSGSGFEPLIEAYPEINWVKK